MKRWPAIFRTLPSSIIQPYSEIFRTLCNSCMRKNLVYSEPWNIENPSKIASWRIFKTLSHLRNLRIFRTLTYLKPDTYSEPSQWFKMGFFAKIVKNCNHFSKALHLSSLNEIWIRLSLNKYPLTCRVTYIIHIRNPVFYHNFRHIQAYSAILWHI